VPAVATLVYIAAAIMVILYVIRLVCWRDPATEHWWKAWFRGETGILDRMEAVTWLPTVALNAMMLVRARRARLPRLTQLWFLGMTFATFVMAGEEVSWGQNVFGFAPPESVRAINAQQEFNFHNLNLRLILGLPADSWLAPRLENANGILNPAYYLFSLIVWVALPFAKRQNRWRLLRAVPVQDLRVAWFLAVNILAWAVVDKGMNCNVGELFEFSLTTTYVLGALDLYRRSRAGALEVC